LRGVWLGVVFTFVCLALVLAAPKSAEPSAHVDDSSARTLVMHVKPGTFYTLTISGSGSAVAYGALVATVSSAHPVSFVAQSKNLWLALSGAVTSVHATETSRRDIPTGLPPCKLRDAVQVGNGSLRADVAVVGADAAGFAAAVSAARRCLSVVLVSSEPTVGGMLVSGQIGVADGLPMFAWLDYPQVLPPNGTLAPQTSWSTSGSLWGEFRERISLAEGSRLPNLPETVRWLPEAAEAASKAMLKGLPNLRVLYDTSPTGGAMSGGRVSYVRVSGSWNGVVRARYWVDGSDAGDLVGLLHLPSVTGTEEVGGGGTPEVMAYAYRWTAVEGDRPGFFPTAPPPYYSLNLPAYRAALPYLWKTFSTQFAVPAGSGYEIQPFRLLFPQGRLNGPEAEAQIDPATGAPLAGAPPVIWDVNGGMNDATSADIVKMLRTDADLQQVFSRYGMPNPYQGTTARWWANIVYIEDDTGLSAADKAFVVEQVKAAVRDRALDLLWFIRSGDMQSALRALPGGSDLVVEPHWSVSNQLHTADGFPSLMYQREGRRIVSNYLTTMVDLCPSFVEDSAKGTVCTTPPQPVRDSVLVNDYPSNLHVTGTGLPYQFDLPWPRQLSLRSLIPKGTTGLLVGGAIGADRLAWASMRVDPVRMLAGNAIGVAIAIAAAHGVSDFTRLNPMALRDALADDGQQTQYVRDLPDWSESQHWWIDQGVGTAVQELIAHDWLPEQEASSPYVGSAIQDPALPLNGKNGLMLWRYVRGRSGAPSRPPWSTAVRHRVVTLAALGVASHAAATVGDAYVWLASRLPQVRAVLAAGANP
jgi:FAD dependent oxidoreductase